MTVTPQLDHLICRTTPSVRPNDTVAGTLSLMESCAIQHLPIVDEDGQFVRLVSEGQLLLESEDHRTLDELLAPPTNGAVSSSTHPVFGARLMQQHALSAVALINEAGAYIGIVRASDCYAWISRQVMHEEDGTLLIVEVPRQHHSVGQLGYLVEQNGGHLQSLSCDTREHSVHLTLQLRERDTARIRHVLEHHGYTVLAVHNERSDNDDIQARIDAFLAYLDV